MFFYLGADRNPGSLATGMILKFAGVLKGYYSAGHPIRVIEAAEVPVGLSNNGIASVVPSYLLHDILFSDELTERRKKAKPRASKEPQ